MSVLAPPGMKICIALNFQNSLAEALAMVEIAGLSNLNR